MKGNEPSEPGSAPVPKRFWWTKRIALAYVLLLAALLLTRWIWGVLAERRLADAVAALKAAGGTTNWQSLEPPQIPPEENAAEYYKRAAAAITLTDDQYAKFDDLIRIPSFRARNAVDADAILAANARALHECRVARPLGVNWGVGHMTGDLAGCLDPQERLGCVLCLSAMRLAERGNCAGAVEALRDAEALARAMRQDTLIMGYFYSQRCHELVVAAVEQVGPRLVADGDVGQVGTAVASNVPAVRGLIADLLDDGLLACLPEVLIATAASTNDAVEADLSSDACWAEMYFWDTRELPWYHNLSTWALMPMYRWDQARLPGLFMRLAVAYRQPTWPLAQKLLSESRFPEDSLRCRTHATSEECSRPFGFRDSWPYWSHTRRSMAATALSLRMFESEKGRPAASLAELVPDYLPAVPVDIFDPAGGPIRALLSAGKLGLYSVGEYRRDEGGLFVPGDEDDQTGDLVFFLRPGDRPERSPTYQPPTQTFAPYPGSPFFGPIGSSPAPAEPAVPPTAGSLQLPMP